MNKILSWSVGFLLAFFVIAGLFSWFTMLLWNETMPYLFGLKELDFWKAVWLYLLSSLLFKTYVPSRK